MIPLPFPQRFTVQVAALAIGAGVLVTSCVMRDRSIESRGAVKAVTKIEKANSNATKLGSDAARKSSDQRVRGIIDPSTRHD